MSDATEFMLTKIIATVGPATSDLSMLVRLIKQGVRVFRINFSHGTQEGFAHMLALVRQAEHDAGTYVGVMGDLAGPKIRVGQVIDGGVQLNVGDRFRLQRQPILAGGKGAAGDGGIVFSTTYPQILDDVQVGERLLIDDGNIRALIIDKLGEGDELSVVANVTRGGRVTSRKGINLPDSDLDLPPLTDHDRQCAQWSIQNGVDLLALSFVRQADDIRRLRALLCSTETVEPAAQDPSRIPIIAKIERPQAIADLDAIVAESDAVMVARGDLGVEMDLAEVPIIQKRIIRLAHDYGKPVTVATQMLQSMMDAPMPTRAEVSDVANAIFDGADSVMLSGETAVGRYPFQAVAMMSRIALAMQRHVGRDSPQWGKPPAKLQESRYRTAALAHGVSAIVRDLAARFVVVWSQRGGGARYLSQNRPTIPILAFSSDPRALRRMGSLFAVIPVLMDRPARVEIFVGQVDRLLQQKGWAKVGDPIVIVAGEPIGTPGVTNKLRIHYVGDECE